MTQDEINYPAVRAANKALIIATAPIQLVHESDRGYDGGEFTDRFYSKIYQELEVKVITHVARRFNIHEVELTFMMYLADDIEEDIMIESHSIQKVYH